MSVEASDRDRPPRSVISLTQIHTFLRLVEEGGVARASDRLGLGHSTVSAHAKLIAEEFGQPQFKRSQGGLVVTHAGLDAYQRLRSIAAKASFCLRYFRDPTSGPATWRVVRMVAGYPGSRLDIAFDRAQASLAARAPNVCLVPAYGGDASAGDDDIVIRHGESGAGQAIRDRWVLIQSGRAAAWTTPVGPAALRGARISLPKLPSALHAGLTALGRAAGADLEWANAALHDMLIRAAQLQNFRTIVPASLLNPAWVADRFECRPIDAGDLDPVIALTGAHPALGEALADELTRVLRDDAPGPGDSAPRRDHEPEALSLKHCRSFLALYEEGNVGRAAQRLSIVQPALTVQLHRIEEQAGCRLFTRSYHGLRANDRADLLYRLVKPMMTEFNAALSHLRAAASAESNSVRVGLIPALDDESVTAQSFAAALNKWSGAHGHGAVQVVEGYSNTLIRWLHSGRIDFALIDRVFPDLGLTFDTIAEDAMVVVTDISSGLLWPGPVTLERLVKLPLVLPSSRHGLRTLIAQSLRERGLSLEPRIEVDSMATCLSLVKIARYATILPMGSVYKSCDRRRLSIHEISEPRIVRKICLARTRNDSCGEAALNFIGELRSAFAKTDAPAGDGLAREIA